MTHEGFIRQQPPTATGSLPQPTRARHASLPRGRLGVEEEGKGKKTRVRHLSLAPHLRLESLEVGAELSEEVGGEPLIGNCENETKTIGRESLEKWKRKIESEREDNVVIQREILTPLSRLAEPTFEEENCNLLEVDLLLQETHRGELSIQEQDRWVASNEILESVNECEPFDGSWGNMVGQQVQMRPLMEEPKACLATEYVPLKLIGLNFCPDFLPIREEMFFVTVKNETEYGLTENGEVEFHRVNVLEGNAGEVSEVRENGKVEVSGGEREVARLGVKSEGKSARERKRRSDKVVGEKQGEMVGSEEGLCLGLVGEEITIARVAATITQMTGPFYFASCENSFDSFRLVFNHSIKSRPIFFNPPPYQFSR